MSLNRYILSGFILILGALFSTFVTIDALAQVTTKPIEADYQERRPITDFSLNTTRIRAAFRGNAIGTSAAQSCQNYYFHNQTLNVGADGVRKIANTTAPVAGSPTEVTLTIPALATNDIEMVRFYSDPVMAADLTISGDIIGTAWIQTTNYDNTTFTVKLYDYNPGNGAKNLLGDIEFKILTDGQYEALVNITTSPGTVVPTGHRLLLIFYARSPLLTSPTVKFFYDSASRASQFRLCQLTPPNLTINKQGPAAVVAGQPITYTITIANTGGQPAANLVISDTLPVGANYVSGGTPVGNEVRWSVGSLAAESSMNVTFVVTASQTITNSDYRVTVNGNISAVGQNPIVTAVSQPGQPNLTIMKSGPTAASAGQQISYKLTITNSGDITATNLVISDTLPAGADYVSGGTLVGNEVRWSVGALAAGSSVDVTFVVTASQTITNSDYRVTALGNILAVGQDPVVTLKTSSTKLFLPAIIKPGIATTLVINSENTGGINPVRVLDINNNELLSCVIGNNVTQTCGTFPAVGTYKLIAHTNNCGVLQGTFNDAAPGNTITRRIYCN